MSRTILDLARTTALAVSAVSAGKPLDRASADATIRLTVRSHGGTRGCAAALAEQYGDYPELAAPRVRWASQRVAALYPPADAERSHRQAFPKSAEQPLVARTCGPPRDAGLPGDWPIHQLAAA